MAEKYWTISEVVEILKVDEGFINELEREEIICPICPKGRSSKHLSPYELDKLRLAKILMEEMDVNLPGVEVILRMRQSMIDMRRQFDDILEDLASQIKETFGENL